MENYNPNIQNGIHTVRITFQQFDYIGHIAQQIGGNCRGAGVLDADFLEWDDQDAIDKYVENDCRFRLTEENVFEAVFKNKNGDTLAVEGDAEEFMDMVVAIEIIDYREGDFA